MATKPTEIPPEENEAAIAPPAKNGASSGPQMVRREKWLNLPGEYEAFQFRCWINYPAGLIANLPNQAVDDQRASLSLIVLEHNGWRDFAGNPYPPTTDPKFWDDIPDEVCSAIFAVIEAEKQELPNLAKLTRRR